MVSPCYRGLLGTVCTSVPTCVVSPPSEQRSSAAVSLHTQGIAPRSAAFAPVGTTHKDFHIRDTSHQWPGKTLSGLERPFTG